MKKVKGFPRNFTTSSAAYRVIKQLQAKGDERYFKMEKISKKEFIVSVVKSMTVVEFIEKFNRIEKENVPFKYFPDGVNGEGFYELKTGDRRRPNSKFIPVSEVYESEVK